MKIIESEKIIKYLACTRELKNLRNMKVTMISIGVGMFGIVPKCLERRLGELEIRGRIKTIQTTGVLKSARILKRVPEN